MNHLDENGVLKYAVLPIVDFGTPLYAAADVVSKPVRVNGVYQVRDVENATIFLKELLTSSIKRLLAFCQYHKALIFIDGRNNYRKTVDPSYKANRTNPLPVYLNLAKEIAVTYFGAISVDGYEADDLVLSHYTYYNKLYLDYIEAPDPAIAEEKIPMPPVIVTVDKDLRQIEGTFIRFEDAGHFTTAYISEKDAIFNLSKQLLQGDSSDGVMGLPGIGKGSVSPILAGDFGIKNPKLLENTDYNEQLKDLDYLKDMLTPELSTVLVAHYYMIYKPDNRYKDLLPEVFETPAYSEERFKYFIKQLRLLTMLRTPRHIIYAIPVIYKKKSN